MKFRGSFTALGAGAIVAITCLLVPGRARSQEIPTGQTVLQKMHDRYENSWYNTLTFTQKSTTHNPDGTDKVETWYEAAMLPGKLRVDVGPPSEGNGVVLADNVLTSFHQGKVSVTRPLVHLLLVLGFDVYHQAPEVTINEVRQKGFDLTRLFEDTWEGQAVYVIGADKGDLTSKQFWIDKKNLLFVRLIEPSEDDPGKIVDTRFLDYRQVHGGWVAARVERYVAGKLVFTEEYSDIQTNVKLDPTVFDPKQFSSLHWEK
jgi:outer membrane lipoprotein-sorting protein